MFGPGGVLDIGASIGQPGSFYATTADVIRMTDGGQFFADSTQALPTLTVTSLGSFGFLTPNPAGITVQGSDLAVGIDPSDPLGPTGKTLALIGGDINVGADPLSGKPSTLLAPSGEIELASLSVPGDVTVSTTGAYLQIDVPGNQGQVRIADFATLDVSDNAFEGDGHSGTVHIVGGPICPGWLLHFCEQLWAGSWC